MSLTTRLGNLGNFFDDDGHQTDVLELQSPILGFRGARHHPLCCQLHPVHLHSSGGPEDPLRSADPDVQSPADLVPRLTVGHLPWGLRDAFVLHPLGLKGPE